MDWGVLSDVGLGPPPRNRVPGTVTEFVARGARDAVASVVTVTVTVTLRSSGNGFCFVGFFLSVVMTVVNRL